MTYQYISFCLVVFIMVGCNNGETKVIDSTSGASTVSELSARYDYEIERSDSLPDPEFLLRLIVKNDNNFGVITKRPSFAVVNPQDGRYLALHLMYTESDIGKIPTSKAYSDSVLSPSKNPLRAELQQFINDSVLKRNMAMAAKDYAIGFSFIKPRSESVFLLDLTPILNKINGRFKIYAFYDSLLYEAANYIPNDFKGYKKVSDIKFDTFYVDGNYAKTR